MNKIEQIIYNNGERLIPGVSHNEYEVIRHINSYKFFVELINDDRVKSNITYPTILDIGCGVGFGAKILSAIENSLITAVDNSKECIEYANNYYSNNNIYYKQKSLNDIINSSQHYDYITMRGVIEHIENGLELIKKLKCDGLVLFDTPYNETTGNPHHKVLSITEETFKKYNLDCSIYYEDAFGNISSNKMIKPNMIMGVIKR